jgi:predicted ABC-type ATPase
MGRSLVLSLLLLTWLPSGWARAATPLPRPCPPLTKNNKPAIDHAAIAALEICLQQLPQTKSLFWRQDNYTLDRQRLHAQIVSTARSGSRCVEAGRRPLALLTAGPPGAGKSTWLSKNLPNLMQPGWLQIDADALREKLPEYQGWNADQSQAETSDLVGILLATIGRPCKTNLLYDGTMTNPGRYMKLLPRLKQLGYRTFIVQVLVPEAVSRQRALERYQRTGRYVPQQEISNYYATAPTTFALLKRKVDGTIQVDGLTNRIIGKSGQALPVSLTVKAP